MASRFAAAAVSSSILLACPELGEGHAVLLEPPSRNYVASKAGKENCPHCLQSGGPDNVKARSQGIWPTVLDPSSHGICGDPVQGSSDPSGLSTSPYMVPTEVQRTYQAGETVEFRVGVNAHHKGHYEFRICDMALDGAKLTTAQDGQNCLNKWVLKRAPVDGSCGSGNSKADCQPIDEKHPGRWYIPPPNQGTMVAGAAFDDEGVPSAVTEYHVMKYKIPEDLECTHCTLQWYWSTGNSCLYDADYLGSDGYFQRNAAAFQALGWVAQDWCPWCVTTWATCDNSCCKTGGSFGEEFWNCADIAVTASGSGPRPAPAPSSVTTTSTSMPVETTVATTAISTTTTTQASGSGGSSSVCTARVGNMVGATNAKCAEACAYVADGQWPCNEQGPCACSESPMTTTASVSVTTTTAAPTSTTTTAASGGNCGKAWEQCAGENWNGATCCVSGYKCNFQSKWYSQCIPQ